MQTLNAAKSSEIRLVVLCDLLAASSNRTSPKREGRTANTISQVGENRYVMRSQETYYVVSQSGHATCEASFRILDTVTGSILLSETVRSKIDDSVDYAEYHGDLSMLYVKPAKNWIPLKQTEHRFQNNRDLESSTEMMNKAIRDIARQIALSVNSYTGSFSP